MYVCNGILFNHESPLRGETFVTRKITRGIAEIVLGLKKKIWLGNLNAQRDWGHARDFVEAMWLMLQQPEPDDFVVATGEMHTVRELVQLAFSHVGLDWQKYVEIDPAFLRPAEVNELCGDASKARRILGWTPTVTFPQLVAMMVDADMARVQLELDLAAIRNAAPVVR